MSKEKKRMRRRRSKKFISMEKRGNSKSSSRKAILKLLPRVASSAVTFRQSRPFSPAREKRLSAAAAAETRGFSGPIVSLIPAEARRNPKNGSFDAAQEPKSPKVSCMGQVKRCKSKRKSQNKVHSSKRASEQARRPDRKPMGSMIREMFVPAHKTEPGRKSSASADDAQPAPLGQMKRFASGRGALADFDWTAQIAPERRSYGSDESGSEEEEDYRVPFSAPILVGGGGRVAAEPRKEVNLWERRTMGPPRPLRINTMVPST